MDLLRIFRSQNVCSNRRVRVRRSPLLEALEGRQLQSGLAGVSPMIVGAHIGYGVAAIQGSHIGYGVAAIQGAHIGSVAAIQGAHIG